jgi:hypothetical protein
LPQKQINMIANKFLNLHKAGQDSVSIFGHGIRFGSHLGFELL